MSANRRYGLKEGLLHQIQQKEATEAIQGKDNNLLIDQNGLEQPQQRQGNMEIFPYYLEGLDCKGKMKEKKSKHLGFGLSSQVDDSAVYGVDEHAEEEQVWSCIDEFSLNVVSLRCL